MFVCMHVCMPLFVVHVRMCDSVYVALCVCMQTNVCVFVCRGDPCLVGGGEAARHVGRKHNGQVRRSHFVTIVAARMPRHLDQQHTHTHTRRHAHRRTEAYTDADTHTHRDRQTHMST
jgi:hypothetical protein